MAQSILHDLEEHIEELRRLDEVRRRSADLLDTGYKVLKRYELDLYRRDNWWYEVALAVRALATRIEHPFKTKQEEDDYKELIKRLSNELAKLKLSQITEGKLSVLAAARILRALAFSPQYAFSTTALVCHYWVIREIYTADRADWTTGGARADLEGQVSAYVTGECVHALLSFAEAFSKTAKFVTELHRLSKRKTELNSLDQIFPAIEKWTHTARKLSYYSSLLSLRRTCPFLPVGNIGAPPAEDNNSVDLSISQLVDGGIKFLRENLEQSAPENYLKALDQIMEHHGDQEQLEVNASGVISPEQYSAARKNFEERLTKLRTLLAEDATKPSTDLSEGSIPRTSSEDKKTFRSLSAHTIALAAVMEGAEISIAARKLLAAGHEPKLDELSKCLSAVAEDIKKLLHPAKKFLSSVLDRELALVMTEQNLDWQPTEMACAAAAYGRLAKGWQSDSRLVRASEYISNAVSKRGFVPDAHVYHVYRDGSQTKVMNSMILTALAQLLRFVREYEPHPELMENISNFFEETQATPDERQWLLAYPDILGSTRSFLSSLELHKLPDIFELLSDESKFLINYFSSYPATNDEQRRDRFLPILIDDINRIIREQKLAGIQGISGRLKDVTKEIAGKLDNREQQVAANRIILEDLLSDSLRKSSLSKLKGNIDEHFDNGGWAWEHSPPPLRSDMVATSHAVFCLAEIGEMLDARINHIIFEHFTVKKPELELRNAVPLSELFYPDYGLRYGAVKFPKARHPPWADQVKWPNKGDIIPPQKSVAFSMQRMRSHVSGTQLWDPTLDPFYSLVLHGPPGTGKTFLVESLAHTCNVPLVEVTPSDLVKHGEENVERRARTVFEALSLLKRVVIIFDEFDPVLRRREFKNSTPPSVFSFLTPGMLPKLKLLHDRAENRAVAYVLITNLIGNLDEAAVRKGRFDERMAVFPPDVLSRTGRLLEQIARYNSDKPPELNWTKIYRIVLGTAGKGMTTLGKRGWLTCPKRNAIKEDTPFDYLLNNSEKEPDWTTAEAECGKIQGEGASAVVEWLQWLWVNDWDSKFENPQDRFGRTPDEPRGQIEAALEQLPEF